MSIPSTANLTGDLAGSVAVTALSTHAFAGYEHAGQLVSVGPAEQRRPRLLIAQAGVGIVMTITLEQDWRTIPSPRTCRWIIRLAIRARTILPFQNRRQGGRYRW